MEKIRGILSGGEGRAQYHRASFFRLFAKSRHKSRRSSSLGKTCRLLSSMMLDCRSLTGRRRRTMRRALFRPIETDAISCRK
jgi:hypothetical protein